MSNNQLSLVKKDTVDVVAQKVRGFQERGELKLPPNYSPENAMKSAWLTLQSTLDKNNKPALEVCTRDSIANALLDMVVQGLNPAKKQCYFIPYGQRLVCQRSYFGSMYLAKQMAGASNIVAQAVYQGDEFKYSIKKGRKEIVEHNQTLESINGKIAAAYCIIEFADERPDFTEIMTMDQIEQAWKQSPMYKQNGNGTHQKFTEEMAKKTVINRACKALINSTSDSSLFLGAINRADEVKTEQEAEQEAAENANSEYIDIDAKPAAEEEPRQDEPEPVTETPQEPETNDSEQEPKNHCEPTGTEGAAETPPF